MRHKRRPKTAVNLRKTQFAATVVIVLGLAILTSHILIGYITASTVSIVADQQVQYSDGQYPFLPGTNRHYVVVTVHVTNHTDSVLHFAPVIQTHLTDGNGDRFDMAPSLAENPIKAGPIAPGETRSGQLSYNVPKKASNLVLHFTPSDTSAEIVVRL